MSRPIFRDPPSVELLQWLARGSLKQNLSRAIRLWVWLRLLYGDESERLKLSDAFTYSQWRDTFFSPSHPKGEEVPQHRDSRCACNKSAANWLFAPGVGISKNDWRRSTKQHAGVDEKTLKNWLQAPLFAMTRRMLAGDLQTLTQLQWLEHDKRKYHRVQSFPNRPTTNQEVSQERQLATYDLNFLPPDLALIAQNYLQQTNGIQRFFLHVDYVVPPEMLDRVDDFQEQLRNLWTQTPVPSVLLVYKSAKLDRDVELEFTPELFDLEPFCQELVEQMQIGAAQEIQFTHHCQEQRFFLDKKLLRSLITNLLSNAIKYSPPEYPIQFKLTRNYQEAVFQVCNQGIGIPLEDRERIYETFYRGKNVEAIAGTGLGLAAVKTCVDLHQGKILINSNVGGTTVTIWLPLDAS